MSVYEDDKKITITAISHIRNLNNNNNNNFIDVVLTYTVVYYFKSNSLNIKLHSICIYIHDKFIANI